VHYNFQIHYTFFIRNIPIKTIQALILEGNCHSSGKKVSYFNTMDKKKVIACVGF